jgi:hypothetical protein
LESAPHKRRAIAEERWLKRFISMRFPYVLRIRVVERGTEIGMLNGAFLLSLLSLKALKNDYPVGPAITDENGICFFTREGCEDAISREQTMFLMDDKGVS